MINFIYFLLISIAIIFLMNPFVTLLHELGHAIPALIFTKEEPIEIYIGSYADKKQTIKIKVGRTLFFIKYNFNIFKIKGLCKISQPMTLVYQRVIFTLGGIILNLITALFVFLIAYFLVDDGLIKFVSAIFIVYSFVLAISNLKPREITGKDGWTHKSDGLFFEKILKERKIKKYLENGYNLFIEKKFQSALDQLEKAIKMGIDPFAISDILTSIFMQLKNYTSAEELLLKKIQNDSASFSDYYNASYISIVKNDFNQAISFTKKALEIEKNDCSCFNMLGYCLIEIGNLEEAEPYLLNALDDELAKPYALNNLAYIKIITDDLEEGLSLIEKSMAIDATKNGHAYRNRGIYYFKTNQFDLAKKDFVKAAEIEQDILHLDEWMEKVKNL